MKKLIDNIVLNFFFYLICCGFAFSLMFINGCDDGGGYEYTGYEAPDNSNTDPTPGDDWFCDPECTPPHPDTPPAPDPACPALPQLVTIKVDDCGSVTQPAVLSGFFVTEEPGVITAFDGVPFNTGVEAGKGVQLSNPSPNSCGPLTLGTISVGPLAITSDRAMEWFLVDKSIFDFVFQQNCGNPPSWSEYNSDKATLLLEAMFECQWGSHCSLNVAPPAGAVTRLAQNGGSFATNQSVCAWTFLVARSL